MTEEKVEGIENDEDDVVIIGDVMPKPMTPYGTKKCNRRVRFKKSKYKKQSLTITQKVKVKRRKYKYIVQEGKMNDTKLMRDSMKKNSICENSTELQDKCERYTPLCLRKSCKWYVEPTRSTDMVKTNKRPPNDFPRDLKRLLSPVSPSPLERDLSFALTISFDTSSLPEFNETKLGTLIKRTRDKDRKNQMTRTQYLFTPPHTDISNKSFLEDMKMTDSVSSVIRSYNLPYTSTPKYEEIKDKNSSISSNNNITELSKNNPFLGDLDLTLSPIEKDDNVPIPQSTNFKEQEIQCFTSLLEDKNIQETKSKSVNYAISNKKFEQNVEDKTVSISNNIKEQINKSYKDIQTQNKISQHVQTDMCNINNEHSSIKNKMPNGSNVGQSLVDETAFPINKQSPHTTSELIDVGVPNNYGQNIEDMSVSNNDKIQTNKICSPSLRNLQMLQKQSEYTRTANFNTNYEQKNPKIITNNFVELVNKSYCSEQFKIQHQSCDIDTIVTNTNGLLIDNEKLPICNNGRENTIHKGVQNKSTEYNQTAPLMGNELNIENRNRKIKHIAQTTTQHTSLLDDVQTQSNQLLDMKTSISEKDNADSRMSISYKKNNIKEQISSQKIKHTNIDSNTNFEQNTEDIDMSISYGNDDNFADQQFSYSLTYEDACLQKQTDYYLDSTVPNTNHEIINDYNRSDVFCTNNKQIVNNEMSTYYNHFIEQHLQQKTYVLSHGLYELNNNVSQQPRSELHLLDENIHAQGITYDTYSNMNSAKQKEYDGRNPFCNNYTEERNRNHSPLFENFHPYKQFGNYFENFNTQHNQNRYRKISISNDSNSNEPQHEVFYEDIYNLTGYGHKTFEQSRNDSKPMFYDKKFKEQRNNHHYSNFEKHNSNEYSYSAHTNEKQIRIRNTDYFYDDDDNSREYQHNNIYQRVFSKNIQEQQRKSDYIHTSYSNKHYNQNKNIHKPAKQRNFFTNGMHPQPDKYKFTHNNSKAYEQNIGDRDMPNSFKNNNFREKPFKRSSPFSYDIRNRKSKFMHTFTNKQRIEERKVSITKNKCYLKKKRNRRCHEGIEDRYYI